MAQAAAERQAETVRETCVHLRHVVARLGDVVVQLNGIINHVMYYAETGGYRWPQKQEVESERVSRVGPLSG